MKSQNWAKTMTENVTKHLPVLKSEVLNFLAVKGGHKYIDTTVGGGGHAEAILEKGGEVLGIDFDPESLRNAEKHLSFTCPKDVYRWRLHLGSFSNLAEIIQQEKLSSVDGIIFDLGISSIQLDDPVRGFSFEAENLDMRINPEVQGVTARDLINVLNEGELYELFTKLGEESNPRTIINAICGARRIKPIEKGSELAQIVADAARKRGKRHPATNVFRALRMAVNDELNNLKSALPQAVESLDKQGRLVIISFHSMEDRVVKNFFKEQETLGILRVLTKKPIVPTQEEIEKNPRSRSAKLRAAEKI
ncbi:MAG: 16S rRNA (cytosine(1402)-N(4))-methyltransferase RsmH [bacterium]|nr:16S rRNA (cytosine(1402)-N(4))-methyltransferase RsmH [bacterium]